MEYNSAGRKNERIIDAKTWMDLENIIPCERSQTQMPHITWFLYEMSRIDKSMKIRSRLVAFKSQGEERMRCEY